MIVYLLLAVMLVTLVASAAYIRFLRRELARRHRIGCMCGQCQCARNGFHLRTWTAWKASDGRCDTCGRIMEAA